MAERLPVTVDAPVGSCRPRTLQWDSAHFGFPVGEIESSTLDDNELAVALIYARQAQHRLVYWSTQPRRSLPSLFDGFGARAVNHRVQYSMELPADRTESCPITVDRGLRVIPCPPGSAGPALEELAILAGSHSRFHVDSRIPVDRFESLYRIWINRSTRRELADQVLVATPSGAVNEAIGLITVSQTGDCGQIGLLAVHPTERGHGIGSLLMSKAHDWMREHGVRTINVVTQLENTPACRLYSRWNYLPINVQAWFHFWLDPVACCIEPRMPSGQSGVNLP